MTQITQSFSSDIFSSVTRAIVAKEEVSKVTLGVITAKKGTLDKFIDAIFKAFGYQNISDHEAVLMAESIAEASKTVTRYETESGEPVFISKPIIHREYGSNVPGIFLLSQEGVQTTLLKFDPEKNKFFPIHSESVKIFEEDNSEIKIEYNTKEVNPGDLRLSDTDLSNRDFSNYDLTGFDFSNAKLKGSNFSNSILVRVTFDGADLRETTFQSSNLNSASMKGAHIGETDFRSADLTNVELPLDEDGAYFACDVKLSGAKISPQKYIKPEDILRTPSKSPYSIDWDSTDLSKEEVLALVLVNNDSPLSKKEVKDITHRKHDKVFSQDENTTSGEEPLSLEHAQAIYSF